MPYRGSQINYQNAILSIKLCTDDLRLVFRQPSDLGHKRKNNTPDPSKILENMKNVVRKWNEMELNGWQIMNQK